jgi:hypothetical protein
MENILTAKRFYSLLPSEKYNIIKENIYSLGENSIYVETSLQTNRSLLESFHLMFSPSEKTTPTVIKLEFNIFLNLCIYKIQNSEFFSRGTIYFDENLNIATNNIDEITRYGKEFKNNFVRNLVKEKINNDITRILKYYQK